MNNLPGTGGLRESQQQELRDALDQAYQISNFLKCGVDKTTLLIMIQLVQSGAKPEHVAQIVSQIMKIPKDREYSNNASRS